MTADELRAMAGALVASVAENGDPFDGHDWDTVQVARWALALLAEVARLTAERVPLRAAIRVMCAKCGNCDGNGTRRVMQYDAASGEMEFSHTQDCRHCSGLRAALLAPKEVPPC